MEMTVKEFVDGLPEEVMNYELLISSDEEGNHYYTVDSELVSGSMKEGIYLVETESETNTLILMPYKEVEKEW